MNRTIMTVIFLLVLCVTNVFADATGKIAGRVLVKGNNSPLEGVSVFIKDTNIGTYTSANGSFVLRNVPVGKHKVIVNFIGYKKIEEDVFVRNEETSTTKFYMEREAVDITGISVTANRAKKRETPIAFSNIGEEEISDKYTTEDMPELLDDVPGLFSSSTGIGEAEITMRGFEADKIQVMINGIPVNDPESQKVYWSNWTGLSSNVKSVQVQKGAGSSLYGSGAFGGSLNIETIGSDPDRELSIRTSSGYYTTEGKVADGKGAIKEYNPINYNMLVRYNSGNLYDGAFNYNLMIEKKAGDSYIIGTDYDGYSFGIELQNLIGEHTINTSFIGAPQKHNQVYFHSDIDLMETLGREYNRNNHEYQENYYFKPQFSIRDQWDISDKQVLMTNFFYTKGDGGGKYLNQDKFDVETGEIHYHDGFFDNDNPGVYQFDEIKDHALFLYNEYGIILDGFVPEDSIYFGETHIATGPSYLGNQMENWIQTSGNDFFRSRYDYSWRNNSISDHQQFGMNTYYQWDVDPMFNVVVGGEMRSWNANHIRKRENFRYYDPTQPDSVGVFDEVQREYDYSSSVYNFSAFMRTQIKPLENLNIMLDGQFASYTSEVEENPIQIFDFANNEFIDEYIYATKNIMTPVLDSLGEEMTDSEGNVIEELKFSKGDYKKTYSFFSPKAGVNYNINENFNVMANYSLAYKEPRTKDWYDRFDGPDGNQYYTQDIVVDDTLNTKVVKFYGELEPEKINTIEFGVGYDGLIFDISANYYYSKYTDKIESVDIPIVDEVYISSGDSISYNPHDVGLTLNAGEAVHKGLELESSAKYNDIDASFSLTLAQNRWEKMNVTEIFKRPAEEMVGKVVPRSPEKMANGAIGYTFQNLPANGKLRIGLTGKWWDGYYASFTNEYVDYHLDSESGEIVSDTLSSELPEFLEFSTNLKYSFKIGNKPAFIRLDFNNIFNRKDNYTSGRVATDYNRYIKDENGELVDEFLQGKETLYVTPAPLLNFFLTMEIKI